jgi:hypothetical protein
MKKVSKRNFLRARGKENKKVSNGMSVHRARGKENEQFF